MMRGAGKMRSVRAIAISLRCLTRSPEEQQIERTLAKDLVGDMDLIALDVVG